METLEQLRKQLTSDLKTSFLKRASDTDSSRKPEDVIGEVSLMLATNIADYSEKLLREIVTPGYVTDEYDKRYTLLSIFNEHEANLREAKHINAEQLAIIDRVTSWFAFDEEHNAVYVKNNYNFYAEGAVSARGFAASGGGGGGGMDEDLLWSILGDGDNPNKQIALSHLEKMTSYVASNYYTKDQIRTTYLTASEIADKYIGKSAFPGIFAEEMANWFKKDAEGNIYAEVNFYSTKGVSAKGLNPGSGGGGGMDEDLLWSILGDGDNPDKQIASTHLTKALAGYATKDWVTDKHYATEQWVTGKGYATVTWVTETFVRKDDYDSLWDAKMDNWFKKDTDGNIYTTVNFYSEQGVSAKGANTSGGGGGGMDEELLWSILGDGDNPGKQIAITHLTTALANYTTVTQVNEAINNKVKEYIPLSAKGASNGVAPLGSDGLISANYLPSYVDDVLEYDNLAAFPAVGETGKIYVTKDTNLTYRWTGTQYVEISKSLALGETADTAYAGSKGKENRDAINKLKNATFWGATYQNDGNVYGTFTGTKIVLSELIQTPKIKIGDIYLEYDAERNAIKGVKYATDGTEVAANLYVTGGLSAKGFSPTSGGGGSTTLADLLDTNITDPQNRQALVYDAASQKWINGQAVGGGDISLNGTLYKAVNGVITLPVASNNKAFNEGIAYVKSDGSTEIGRSLDFHDPNTTDQDYDYRLQQIYDNGAVLVGSGKFRATEFQKVGGTASQFLKADGSIDSNLYALAYEGNQNKTQHSEYSRFTSYFQVINRRSDTPKPNSYEAHNISAFFNASNGMPNGNWWSGFHVRGWGEGYCTWELVGPSSTNNTAYNLRYRTGIGDTWGAWKMIMTDVEADGRYVIKTGDTMTGALIINVPNIPATPSISSPTKIGFKENNAQEVAFAYTDYDSYRAPAGIKLVSTESEPWFEAPWILGRKLNMSRVATEYSAGTGAVLNYFGTDTIFDGQNSVLTGTMKIQLPVSWSNTMGVYKIMLYEYNGRGSSEIIVSFYNYSSSESYYNYSYQVNGAFEGAVRVAYDGSKCCILLGDTSYSWNYPKVYMYQVFAGQSVPSNYADSPYKISIITSESGLTKVTAPPKTSMNKHDTNYIRALNKNGYYGMAIVGDADDVYIRTPRLGIIPYSSGNPSESMLGTVGWQFSHVYANQIKTQRVSSVTNDIRIGSSDNAGWVYCQDLCSANGAAEAYWSIRTNGAAVFTNLTSKNKITGNLSGSIDGNAAGYATYLPTRYDGGTKANPQTYFGQSIGVKVAMTGIGWGGPWGDTLWINGYSGGDVLPMCTLHFIRNGTPRFGISTQNSNGTSYGTNYEVWTAYNSNKDGVNWSAQTFFSSIGLKSRNICIETNNSGVDGGCSSEINNWNSHLYLQHKTNTNLYMCKGGGVAVIGDINAAYRLNVAGDIIAAGWLRTSGAVGWYSQTYGGGIYMADTDHVQVYNNKVFYNSGYRSWGIGGHFCALKLYNASHIGLNLANNSYTWGIYSNNNGNMYIGRRDGDVNNTSGTYVVTIGLSTFSMAGNIVATGGITAKTSSDEHLKNLLPRSNYAERLLSLGNVFDFVYNETAKRREGKQVDGATHTGLSYQKVSSIMPTICGKDPDGYGWINYIHPDFVSLIAGATQLNTLGIKSLMERTSTIEDEIRNLRTENEKLKTEIINLKQRL